MRTSLALSVQDNKKKNYADIFLTNTKDWKWSELLSKRANSN